MLFKCILIFILFFCSQAKAQGPTEALHLTLKQAMAMARSQNAQVIAANEHLRQVIAGISMTRAGLLPQITASVGGKRQTSDLRAAGIQLPGDPHIGPYNSFDARARLTMDIFDVAAVERLQSAKAGQKLSKAQLDKVREDVLALVGAVFLQAQRAHQSVALTEANLRYRQRQYEITLVRFNQGTASQSDLNKAKTDLAQAHYTMQSAVTLAQQARFDLASALKISLHEAIIFEDEKVGTDTTFSEAAEKVVSVPTFSPEVAVAQAQLEQSQADQSLARADFLPKVTASGDYGRLGKSPDASSTTYSVGLSVSVPVWEGGSKQAQLESAKSKVKENEILLADAKDKSQSKILQAQQSLIQAKALVKAKAQQLEYASHQLAIAQEQLKSGRNSQLQVDEANANEALSLDEKNEAWAVYWTAKINLAHAMGQIEEVFDLK